MMNRYFCKSKKSHLGTLVNKETYKSHENGWITACPPLNKSPTNWL